jgi:hypothetical protein
MRIEGVRKSSAQVETVVKLCDSKKLSKIDDAVEVNSKKLSRIGDTVKVNNVALKNLFMIFMRGHIQNAECQYSNSLQILNC